MKLKLRPSILIGQVSLAVVACIGMYTGYEQVTIAAVVGMSSTMHKLVESEEKSCQE